MKKDKLSKEAQALDNKIDELAKTTTRKQLGLDHLCFVCLIY